MKLVELKQLMKENNIKGTTYLNKPEIIKKLILYKVLPEDFTDSKEHMPVRNKNALNHIRNNPRQVEIENIETGEVVVFPSMYKAGRFFEQSASMIGMYENKVWKRKYKIKVFPKETTVN